MILGMFGLLGCLALFVVVGGIFFVLMALLRGRGYGYYRTYRRPWFFGAIPFLFDERPFVRREEFFEHRHHHHEHHHHHHDGGFGGHHGGGHHSGHH
jgi:hypothetical protein